MKRLYAAAIGIDQGNVNLFSDFATDGDMWTGHGPRERSQWVDFSEKFASAPMVTVSLSLWDMDSNHNVRAEIEARDITPAGFNIVFKTWGDSRIARVRMSWQAIGELHAEDQWDVF